MDMTKPQLAKGETYIGLIGDADGNTYHAILLPGDNDAATFEAALAWAKSLGGDLPSRIEQAMLLDRFRDQLRKGKYWSNETHPVCSNCARSQSFYNGNQSITRKADKIRAIAVRRLVIE